MRVIITGGAITIAAVHDSNGPAILKSVILINISGEDQPGVTSAVTKILAAYKINVLDIGQAVIHDRLSLGMLIEVPSDAESSPVVKDILFCIHELGLTVKFTPIKVEDYEQWVKGQGKDRHIITLLARKITAEHISRVTQIAANYALNIDRIDRLSGRVSLGRWNDQVKSCVEFSVRGGVENLAEFREAFMQLASELDVDIAYQEDDIFRRNRRLVVFDMDSTLIETEVIDELAKAAGVGDKVAEITESAMRGEIEFNESFERRMALLKGLPESVMAEIAEQLPITEGAEHLISTLKSLGYKTAILSGGFNYFGNYLKKRLGIDYVYANELEFENGVATGRVVGTVVDGARKAELLKEIAQRENIALQQAIAVGDGANDLPMLSAAGLGIAFRAKPLVRNEARHSISTLGLDGILYMLGISDRHVS